VGYGPGVYSTAISPIEAICWPPSPDPGNGSIFGGSSVTFQQSLLVRHAILTIFLIKLLTGVGFATGPGEFLLYSFPTRVDGPAEPYGSLVEDGAGNLYGTTFNGGAGGRGSVYELERPTAPATEWTETEIYAFADGNDGNSPIAGLAFDQLGNLYGTTSSGGTSGLGTVFELMPPATKAGEWTESVLYSFQGGSSDGSAPSAELVLDSAGNLYGVTAHNGLCAECGVIYELTPPTTPGAPWGETILHYFNSQLYKGGQQYWPTINTLIFDAHGNLYGTAGGGPHGGGVVFRLLAPAASGGSWTYRILYAFTGGSDGGVLLGGLTLRGRTVLYGTTYGGGSGYGVVFQIVPPTVAGGAWTENVLHTFVGGKDGAYGEANPIFDKAGNMYGTTINGGDGEYGCGQGPASGCGTVFQLTPPANVGDSWTETILHSFAGNEGDAFGTFTGLTLGENGLLFGVTVAGGSHHDGAVYAVVK
jgi:uncharacterized repeat protein (TIGR03803 family)